MKKVCPKSTEATSVLKNFNRCQQGRPRIEVDQPENLSTIFKIVQNSATANNRRRAEFLPNIPTLDDLHTELTKKWDTI